MKTLRMLFMLVFVLMAASRGHDLSLIAALASPAQATRNLSLVGALDLRPVNGSVPVASVTAFNQLAFIGMGRLARCVGTGAQPGVHIVDVSDPETPVYLASTSGDIATAKPLAKAISIKDRVILVVGRQACTGAGKSGIELWDVSQPASPQMLSTFATNGLRVGGIDLTYNPGGRILALVSAPTSEVRGRPGDLLIVDISDPTGPALVATWGLTHEATLGSAWSFNQGSDLFTSYFGSALFDVRASPDGATAYLSYLDAGTIMLDLADPVNPIYLGRTSFGPTDEGNAYASAALRGGTLLAELQEFGIMAGGGGSLRFVDTTDPASPAVLSTFVPAGTATLAPGGANWVEVRGNTVYASYYADGVRLIDTSQASWPRESGAWTGAGAPIGAPSVQIVGALPHRNMVLAVDRRYGLYVLRTVPR